MNRVELIFPDTYRMATFVVVHEVGGLVVESISPSVAGVLTDEEIALACTEYGAEIMTIAPLV